MGVRIPSYASQYGHNFDVVPSIPPDASPLNRACELLMGGARGLGPWRWAQTIVWPVGERA